MFRAPGQRVADRIIDGIYGKVITDGFENIDGKNKYLYGEATAFRYTEKSYVHEHVYGC